MKMPCTQHDDQEQHESQRVSFRSTFNRGNTAGPRYQNQQNLHSFAIPLPNPHQHQHQHQHHQHQQQQQQQQEQQQQHHHHHHHHHHRPIAIIPRSLAPQSLGNLSGSEDVTEQIRISVQDTHISHGSSEDNLGGNIAQDFDDSMEESYLAYYSNLQHQEYQDGRASSSLIQDIPNQNQSFINHHAHNHPTASTSSSSNSNSILTSNSILVSSGSSSSRVSATEPQQQQFSAISQPRRLIVLGKGCCDESQQNELESDGASPNLRLLEVCKPVETKCVENQSSQPETSSRCHREGDTLKLRQPQNCEKNSSEKLSIIDFIPSYIHKQDGIIKSHLYNGSSFSGQQNSRNESYDVNVKIQHIDYDSSYLNGYLCIAHLTKTHPTLTTFFEGEIISEQYPFLTRKWEATKEIDRAHWSKFEGFNDRYFEDTFDYNELKKSDYIYMRWKELFLVPDHTIKNVEGASYAGFYYVCYSKRTSQIKGYYFHIAEHFERFQSLNLEIDCEERTSQVYEFR